MLENGFCGTTETNQGQVGLIAPCCGRCSKDVREVLVLVAGAVSEVVLDANGTSRGGTCCLLGDPEEPGYLCRTCAWIARGIFLSSVVLNRLLVIAEEQEQAFVSL